MSKCDCCGCQVADDYGTSTASGTGTAADPFMITRVDPAFVRPMVRVTGGVIAAIPNNTPTPVPFSAEIFDTDNMWVIGNPTIITIQTAGFFIYGSRVVWPSNNVGNRHSFITHFPVSGPAVGSITNQDNAPTGDYDRQLNYQSYFSVGDQLRLDVAQVSGGALNLTASVFWAVYIGRKV